MLEIVHSKAPVSRRSFLTVGGLGIAGLSLPSLLARRAAAGEESTRLTTGKSVIFLFQQGGPSQFETYDPKPDAPEAIRTVGETIPTALPGVRFGERLPQLARRADRLAIIRSFQTGNANHNIVPIMGADSLNANIGGLYSRVVGSTRADTGMPTNSVVFPDAVLPDVLKGRARGDIAASGSLGRIHAPFSSLARAVNCSGTCG